ncbi:hypothetical protein F9K33_16400 [bacterium]|nr:MAG: hypothetical protein F9K33_16400 [bacterium]
MRRFLLIAITISLLISCKGPAGDDGDPGQDGTVSKQERFVLVNGGLNTTDSVIIGDLIKFDIRNYTGVDSVIFVAFGLSGNVASSCIIELYNLTDSSTVQNSTLSTTSNSYVLLQSGNLFGHLPEKEITLGIKLKPSIPGQFAGVGKNFLFLYR